jgi:hypothetical protein
MQIRMRARYAFSPRFFAALFRRAFFPEQEGGETELTFATIKAIGVNLNFKCRRSRRIPEFGEFSKA